MTKHLFLDANVFLSFYLFGKDDLEEMLKVVKLIHDEEIVLLSNNQLIREIWRNREAKIAEGFSSMKTINFDREFPNYCIYYMELDELKKALKEVGKIHTTLVTKIQNDIDNFSLKADTLINELLNLSNNLPTDDNLLEKARIRNELGDPPGKRGSLGDSIHWEALLQHADAVYLDIVSLDSDFSSPLNPNNINEYLSREWHANKKWGSVTLFRSLSNFFKSRFPSIELSKEYEKDELIQQLKGSPNFFETHKIVEKLSEYDSFTKGQIRGLFSALMNNTQVSWIATDPDIKSFYCSLNESAWHLDYSTITQAETLLEVDSGYFAPF